MRVTYPVGIIVAALSTGCFGGESMVPERGSPSDPAPAGEAWVGWPQQVWFRPPAGARLESLVPAEGGAVGTWVFPDGARIARRVTGPDAVDPAQPVMRPSAPQRTSATSDDGQRRVVLTPTEGRVSLKLLGPDGGQVLASLPSHLAPHEPDFVAGGAAVVVRLGGDAPRIVRVPVAGGDQETVVPGPIGPHVVVRSADGDGILFADPDDGSALVWASAPEATLSRAGVVVGQVSLPGDLVPVLEGSGGAPLRGSVCGETPRLSLRATASDGVTLGDAPVTAGQVCGDGCTRWYQRRPSGAPRLVAELAQRDDGLVEALLAAAVGQPSGLYASGDGAAALPRLPGCLGDPPDGALLARVVWRGSSVIRLDPGPEEGVLVTTGPGAPKARLVTPGSVGAAMSAVIEADAPGRMDAVDVEGVPLVFEDGAILRRVDEGEPVVVLAAGDARSVTGIAPGPDPSVAWFTDQGNWAGLFRAQVGVDVVTPGLTAKGLDWPVAVRWDGQEGVAVRQVLSDTAEQVWVGTPFTDADRAAWKAGPRTLLDIEPTWVAVTPSADGLRPCPGGRITLGADADGGFLEVVSTPGGEPRRWAARGASFDGQILRVLAEGGDTPTVLATLRVGEGAARWTVHVADPAPVGTGWLAEPQVADRTPVAACAP